MDSVDPHGPEPRVERDVVSIKMMCPLPCFTPEFQERVPVERERFVLPLSEIDPGRLGTDGNLPVETHTGPDRVL